VTRLRALPLSDRRSSAASAIPTHNICVACAGFPDRGEVPRSTRLSRVLLSSIPRPPAEITLLDIFEIIQGPLGLTSCTVEGNWCPRESRCSLSAVWHDIQAGIHKKLQAASLAKLTEGYSLEDGCPMRVE